MFADAASDAESILSDMSDEFMVVPVPPCFDPEAPLTADPAHVTVSMTEYKQMTESQQGSFSLNLSGHTSLEADFRSGPASASYADQSIVTSVETTLEVDPDAVERDVTSVKIALEAVSGSGQKGISSTDATLEMTSRASMEEENHVFDLANETVPLLPEPLIPEPGQDTPASVESQPGDLSCSPVEPPITHEPLPAPEPTLDGGSDDDDDDSDDDDDDDDDDDNDGPAQPEVSPQPIAAQPVAGPDEPPPVALQPEPSAAVNVVPTTVRSSVEVYHVPSSSGDFPSNVVSDVLSTAIDAVASAGRAVMTTMEKMLDSGPKPQTTASYNPDQGCEISVSSPAESDEAQTRVSWFLPALFCTSQ